MCKIPYATHCIFHEGLFRGGMYKLYEWKNPRSEAGSASDCRNNLSLAIMSRRVNSYHFWPSAGFWISYYYRLSLGASMYLSWYQNANTNLWGPWSHQEHKELERGLNDAFMISLLIGFVTLNKSFYFSELLLYLQILWTFLGSSPWLVVFSCT